MLIGVVPKQEIEELIGLIPSTFKSSRLEALENQKSTTVVLTPEDQLMLVLESGPPESRSYSIDQWSAKPIGIEYSGDGCFIISYSEPIAVPFGDYSTTVTKSDSKEFRRTTGGGWGGKVTFYGTFDVGSLGGSRGFSTYKSSYNTKSAIPGYNMESFTTTTTHTNGVIEVGSAWCKLDIKPAHNIFGDSIKLVAYDKN